MILGFYRDQKKNPCTVFDHELTRIIFYRSTEMRNNAFANLTFGTNMYLH